MFHPNLGRWLQQDPIGFDAGDHNLYRTEENNPTNFLDAYGLEAKKAELKEASEASEQAKAALKLLPDFLAQIKDAAKNTTKLERYGAVMKAAKKGVNPEYKFLEFISKATTETSSSFKPLFLPKAGHDSWRGCYVYPPNKDGIVDLDTKQQPSKDYAIEFIWHTHPPFPAGEAFPSPQDSDESKDNKIVDVMIQYIKRGKNDEWTINIVDIDGKYFVYEEPKKK